MTQPPRKCAVIGTSTTSPIVPPGVGGHVGALLQPRGEPADRLVAHGIQVGFGTP